MSVKMRQEVERKIATAIVDGALAAGYSIGVDNGGEHEEYNGSDKDKILAAMFQTDEEHLFLYKKGSTVASYWCLLVYGNDGWDVLSDYTSSLDSTDILTEANRLADHYAD